MENTDKQFVLEQSLALPSLSLLSSTTELYEWKQRPNSFLVWFGVVWFGVVQFTPEPGCVWGWWSHHGHPWAVPPCPRQCSGQQQFVELQETLVFLSFLGPFQATRVWWCQRSTVRWKKGRVRGGRGGGGFWMVSSCPRDKSFSSRWYTLQPEISPWVCFDKRGRKGWVRKKNSSHGDKYLVE